MQRTRTSTASPGGAPFSEPSQRSISARPPARSGLPSDSLQTPFLIEPPPGHRPGTTFVLPIPRPRQTPPYASATDRSRRGLQQLVRIDRGCVGLAGVEAILPWNLLSSYKPRWTARRSAAETVDGWIERTRSPATVCAGSIATGGPAATDARRQPCAPWDRFRGDETDCRVGPARGDIPLPGTPGIIVSVRWVYGGRW